MTKLIINADDFGYSKGLTYGIAESHWNGVVTSTTMMANMFGLKHALKLIPQLPKLGIGIHLSLTMGRPVSEKADALVNENGEFKTHAYYTDHTADLNQLYEEWKAQIEKLLKLGVNLTHIDSHHYMHAVGEHLEVTERLSEQFSLPIRTYGDARERAKRRELFPADAFWNIFNYPPMKDMDEPLENKKKELMTIIKEDAAANQHYSIVEASCHPGYLDTEVYYRSSFNLPRMREIDILTSPEKTALLNEYDYTLCHYGQL